KRFGSKHRHHSILTRALVRQSRPALAIFQAGRACGIPYAPELGVGRVDIPAAFPVPQPVEVPELARPPAEVAQHKPRGLARRDLTALRPCSQRAANPSSVTGLAAPETLTDAESDAGCACLEPAAAEPRHWLTTRRWHLRSRPPRRGRVLPRGRAWTVSETGLWAHVMSWW